MPKKKIDGVIDSYRDIARILKGSGPDLNKLKEGNKAAGTRLRKGLLEIRDLCNAGRKGIQEYKNEL